MNRSQWLFVSRWYLNNVWISTVNELYRNIRVAGKFQVHTHDLLVFVYTYVQILKCMGGFVHSWTWTSVIMIYK